MPKRKDFPLGGLRRKSERQRADRERARRKGKLDRVADAFEQRSRSLGRSERRWHKALTSERVPFSWR